jgi:small GTP-binding protein
MPDEAAPHKVVFVGDSGVGKTSIIHSLLGEKLTNLPNTVGGGEFRFDGLSQQRQPVHLSIWDTAGQDAYQSLVPTYVRNSRAVLLTFDVTDDVSFESIPSWVHLVKETQGEPLMYIIGNKVDMDEKRVISLEQAQDCAGQFEAKFFETSAKTGVGIQEAFAEICNDIGAARATPPAAITESAAVELNETQQSSRRRRSLC